MRKFRVKVNGSVYEVEIEEIGNPSAPSSSVVTTTPVAQQQKPAPPAQPIEKNTPSADTNGGIITAQMPGTIVDIHVSVGDQVSKGQNLLILEAMKMENEVVSPQDGVVQEIHVTTGGSVNAGDVLVALS